MLRRLERIGAADAKTKGINEINATKEHYSTLMEVQAPVEYWESKAAIHNMGWPSKTLAADKNCSGPGLRRKLR
jgi:hypothetical protein